MSKLPNRRRFSAEPLHRSFRGRGSIRGNVGESPLVRSANESFLGGSNVVTCAHDCGPRSPYPLALCYCSRHSSRGLSPVKLPEFMNAQRLLTRSTRGRTTLSQISRQISTRVLS